MIYLKSLFAVLAIFILAASLRDEEEIMPVDLAYKCINNENEESQANTPILLLHGMGGSKKIWNRLSAILAQQTKRKVCAVDLRNHGDSPWNNRTDIDVLSLDVGSFLDKQGMDKINIIGQSLGGKTAIHFTLKNPDRVNSIIIEDINPNTISQEAITQILSSLQFLNVALQSIPEGTNLEDAKKCIVNFMNKELEKMGSSERIPDAFTEFIEIECVDGKYRFKYNVEVLGETLKNIENFWTISTGLYEGPALFIYGTKSPFKVNEDKENILQLFPKAQLFPIEGAGHIIQGVFPDFDDAVIKFLNKIN